MIIRVSQIQGFTE